MDSEKIIEQSPLPTFVIDSNGFVEIVNKAFLEAYGVFDREEIIGTNALTQPANIRQGVVKYMENALKGKVIETPEIDFVTPHGVRRVTKSRLFPIFDENKKLTHVVVMHEDITDRKRAEEEQIRAKKEAAALKERAEIIEAIPEVIFILDRDINLVDFNDMLVERTGFSPEEVKGSPVFEFIVEDDREMVSEGIEKAIEKGWAAWEGSLITKKGETIPHSWSVSSIKDDENNLLRIVGIGKDITVRKGVEEELRKSRERYRTLMETADEIILAHDVGEGGITYANNGAARQLGYEVEELLGMNLYDLIQEDEVFKIKEIEKRRKDGDSSVYKVETKAIRKDRTVFPVKASSKPVSFTSSGKPKEILIIARNISERKRAEEREEFLHSLLRHDVRNKAQIARGYFELLEEENLPKRAEDYFEKTKKACDEAIEIIEKVRKLREIKKESEFGVIELRSIIGEVIDEHGDQLSEKCIELNCENYSQSVKGGPLLEELFSNLLENAIRHSDCDKIRIYCDEREDECIVTVEDNGCGISEEDRDKVFERGFKKGDAGGSGIGLYLVKEIAKGYDSSIEVKDSELGGARFDIHLKKA